MTKLDALNLILKVILERDKDGATILDAINEAVKYYGGEGNASNNAEALDQLCDVLKGETQTLKPENIRKGVKLLGVEGDDWQIETKDYTGGSFASSVTAINTKLLAEYVGTTMDSMFSGCTSLTELNLSNFDTSKVTDMYSMFSYCYSLAVLNLSNFDTSKVTDMDGMFSYCSSLAVLNLGSNWASNNSITSFDLSSCPLTKESALDVLNKLADRTQTTNKPALKLRSTTKALLTEEELQTAKTKGWTIA